MRRRLAQPIAFMAVAMAVVGAIGGLTIRTVDPVPVLPDTLGFSDVALVAFAFLGVTFAAVGALLVVRRPENAVGWCMLVIGVSNALAALTGAATFTAAADGPAGATAAGVAGWLTVLFVMTGTLVFGIGFIFPTGHGHTPAWDRFVRVGAVALLFMLVVFFLIRPGPLQLFSSIDNPFGIGPDLRPIFGPQISVVLAASGLPVLPLLALSIVTRYRMSDRVGRQQLKWFILSLAVALGGIAVAVVGTLAGDGPREAGLVVFGFAGALIPVAIGIAILRHNLYDIDRLISRTISYAAVTAILAAVFGTVALVLGVVLGTLGQGQGIAVAGSTLLVAILFGPVRRRAQSAVDQQFDRYHYDASRTVQALTTRLRDDVDLERVEADVVGVVHRAFHPRQVGVWLRGPSR
jgi:hypothetical protein